MTPPLKIIGAYASPYSRKMRAALRYRRIPFEWVPQNSAAAAALPRPTVPVIPVLAFPDDDGAYTEVMTDSSPQIMRLEGMHSDRSLVPTDPVVAFIDYLLEDFADEWVTKMMYHYRWYYDGAIDKAGKMLPLQADVTLADDAWDAGNAYITNRQIERRALVGSTEENRPAIEDSYVRLLGLLDAHLHEHDFLFGIRPSRADMGLHGQLTQLTWWDPEAVAVAVESSARTCVWVDRNDDLSWWPVDGDTGWLGRDAIPATTRALLDEAGRTYAPFMLANAAAFEGDDEMMSCTIDGNPYSQARFKYQRKCLQWLRDEHAALDDGDRAAVDTLLAGTGCEVLFA
ncbi:MAG: glutathione S-transferase [Acidimicrobiales bacterium]|nr:MAG: glutathione S-transferase [Acidimicrobiales bacterium]